ncbi:hypothetical protein K466DRAFT_592947 [Polyporus arcularius HHB13444]|uniref:Uncharacterized protein n=1 Tax=Polyporus arcularius HHB13444 TaxID=1314778 RepID=A0A5C3NL67_9APHY|nr:hypothetical protein K466DRAFT_592947 [Polyporus arcularius HHB13444]
MDLRPGDWGLETPLSAVRPAFPDLALDAVRRIVDAAVNVHVAEVRCFAVPAVRVADGNSEHVRDCSWYVWHRSLYVHIADRLSDACRGQSDHGRVRVA